MQSPVVLYSATASSATAAKQSTQLAAALLRNILAKHSLNGIMPLSTNNAATTTSTTNISLAYSLLNRLKYILLNSNSDMVHQPPALTQHGSTPHNHHPHHGGPTHLYMSPNHLFSTHHSTSHSSSSFLFNLFNFNPTFPFSLSLGEYKRINTSHTTLHLITAYSGYSKDYLNNNFNTNIKRTELGCSSTSSSNGNASTKKKGGVIGDDAWFITKQRSIDVLGVADGVGGWHSYGIDPSKFSFNLMKTCKRIVEQDFTLPQQQRTAPPSSSTATSQSKKPSVNRSSNKKSSAAKHFQNNMPQQAEINSKTPLNLLEESYRTLLENKNSNLLVGSSTACILIFHHETSLLHTCNLGDSGFVIVRGNEIIHRSQEQQHYFNSPYQIAILPNSARDLLRDNMIEEEVVLDEPRPNRNGQNQNTRSSLINDSPDLATSCSIELREGDFIVVGTDGLWDNLTETHLLNEIAQIKVCFASHILVIETRSR
jgi:serine/threonine protein phosphatase PrpC